MDNRVLRREPIIRDLLICDLDPDSSVRIDFASWMNLKCCAILNFLHLLWQEMDSGLVRRREGPVRYFVNLAEIFNLTSIFFFPNLSLCNLNFARDHINKVKKLVITCKISFNCCLGCWVSQIFSSVGIRREANGIQGADLEQKVTLRPHHIQMIVSVVDFW